MRHIIRYSVLAIAAAMMLCSCAEDEEAREDFVKTCPGPGLTIGAECLHSFEIDACQLSCSSDRRQFRVSDDNMNSYYILDKVDRMPSGVGSTLKGDLIWTTDKDVRYRGGLEFKVIRVEQDYYWLWNRRNDIGLVIRYIR